jgi:uridine phosphorylase
MSNHHRGLWGYYGETNGGRPLTIQATGIGGPSAAVVLSELAELGVRRAIRVGTGVAASDEVGLGAFVVPSEAVAGDGTSRELGTSADLAQGAAGLTSALAAQLPGARGGSVATVDVYYVTSNMARNSVGVDAYEMATAPLFVLGQRLGVEVACVLAIVETGGERLGEEELLKAELEMGRAAAAALAD